MSISSELKAKTLKLTLKFIFGSSNVKQRKKETSQPERLKEAALNFKKLVTDRLKKRTLEQLIGSQVSAS